MRSAAAIECLGITYGVAWGSFLVLIPLTAISAQFADLLLDQADRLLGFDFVAYADLARPFINILRHSYASYHWQPLLIIGFLCFTDRTARCWGFVTAGTMALAITCVIYPLFPAEGPFVYYGIREYGPILAPWQFGPVLHAIKDGARLIDYSLMTGLVSLPSYHAAAACIFVWSTWPTILRWVLVPLNILLLLATIVIGSHYLVDVIAGIAVGIASIAITTWLLKDKGPAPKASSAIKL
ncbi:MAG: phosphatase PAP2 family protein [Alteraurantiacibacter sp.]